MSGRGRLRRTPRPQTGKRASEASASTSANAFELFRTSSDVLSRVTDAASSQLIVDAPASEYRSESDFPACGVGGRAPDVPAAAPRIVSIVSTSYEGGPEGPPLRPEKGRYVTRSLCLSLARLELRFFPGRLRTLLRAAPCAPAGTAQGPRATALRNSGLQKASNSYCCRPDR